LYEYKHIKPGKGALQLLAFAGTVYGLYVASSFVYPDRPSAPKEYEGGLDKELGGEGAVPVSKNLVSNVLVKKLTAHQGTQGR
jgi:hypothetical protein